MSADSSTNAVMKGIKHGACDYLIKPVRMEELKNIWQHVVRKKFSGNKEHEHSGSLDDTDRTRPTNNDNEYASSANDGADDSWKSQKKKRYKEDDDSELESGDPSNSSKKPRVVWSVELHQQFVNAVNHLGIDSKLPLPALVLILINFGLH
jgi:two-component response regulator (ARR-B family)